jgi:RAB protein geranylgeranyltransferase component A
MIRHVQSTLESDHKINAQRRRGIKSEANAQGMILLKNIISFSEESTEALSALSTPWDKCRHIVEKFSSDEKIAAHEFFSRSQDYYDSFEDLIEKLKIYTNKAPSKECDNRMK